MNVLIMADYTPGISGNFIGSLFDLAAALARTGGRLVVAVPDTGKGPHPWEKMLAKADAPVVYLQEGLGDAAQCAKIDELLKTYQIDLIHIHFGLWVRTFCKYRRRWAGIPILVHDHFDYEVYAPLWKQKLRHWGHAAIYRLCGMGVISVMEKKNRGYFLCGQKHWHVPNGISFARNLSRSMDREETRDLLHVASGEKLCILLGWDMKRKGIDLAVRAVQLCRNRGECVVLGIIGLGDCPTDQQKQWLWENTGISPEEPWIRYFPGTEDMYAYHRAADAYLSASRMEAFSYGLLEAISQNVPVAVSRIPGTLWASEYSKCVLFENEDVEGCAQAISRALEMRDLPSNDRQITERYSIARWCQAVMEIYRKMLEA